MQKLHLVGFTTDRRSAIFSARRGSKSGGYTVELDDSLFALLDDVRAMLAEADAEPEEAPEPADRLLGDDRPQSSLSVREVQARLRQGRKIDAVAKEAGVDVAWVERFAAPVLTELAEIVRSVRAKRFAKQRSGTSGSNIGESVYRNLVERGVTTPREELDRGWSARQLADGEWEVRFTYVSRGRTVSVAWAYDEATGKVRAQDRLAGELAFRAGGPPPARRARGTGAGAVAVAEAAVVDDERPPDPDKVAKAAAKRVAAARRAARARMVADAERATKRNAKAVRKAAATPARRRTRASADREAGQGAEPEVEVEELEWVEELDVELLEEGDEYEDLDEADDDDDLLDDIDEEGDDDVAGFVRSSGAEGGRRRLLEVDEADEAEEPDLALTWSEPGDDDAPAAAARRRRAPLRATAADGGAAAPARGARRPRLQAERPPSAGEAEAAPGPEPTPTPTAVQPAVAPRPRGRREPLDVGALTDRLAGGPAPTFRPDMAQRAAEEPPAGATGAEPAPRVAARRTPPSLGGSRRGLRRR